MTNQRYPRLRDIVGSTQASNPQSCKTTPINSLRIPVSDVGLYWCYIDSVMDDTLRTWLPVAVCGRVDCYRHQTLSPARWSAAPHLTNASKGTFIGRTAFRAWFGERGWKHHQPSYYSPVQCGMRHKWSRNTSRSQDMPKTVKGKYDSTAEDPTVIRSIIIVHGTEASVWVCTRYSISIARTTQIKHIYWYKHYTVAL